MVLRLGSEGDKTHPKDRKVDQMMIRTGNRGCARTAALCGMALAAAVQAASMVEVPRATWAGGVNLPSYAKMYVYVPDKVAAKPPLVVSNHSCGSSASGQMGNTPKIKALADKNGFIMILPDNPGQNCWDVGSKAALTRDGGGDPHAIATMVRYALKKYNADSTRVYVVGGSSGGMMTQALSGIYPDLFAAAAPRAGVPCGCWAEGYTASNQWSGNCSGGKVDKTGAQWGDLVRAINPDYKGHRPRMMIFHGDADETINYNNFKESMEQWTNVLGLSTTATTTDKVTTVNYSYNRQIWKNTCGYQVLQGWTAPGQKHSMKYEEDDIIKFFGLDVVGGQDPERAACPSGLESRAGALPKSHAMRGGELVLHGLAGDQATVRILNTAGQVQSTASSAIAAHAGSVSVPVSRLAPGYYLASVATWERGVRLERFDLGFAIAK